MTQEGKEMQAEEKGERAEWSAFGGWRKGAGNWRHMSNETER